MIDETLLKRLYREQPLPPDALPYTTEFDLLVEKYNSARSFTKQSHHDLYRKLLNIRKSGGLVRKVRGH